MTALAFAAAGLLVVLLALIDLFLTVFNYDGFSFIAARYQSLLWRVMQLATRPLPNRARHALLSIGSSCRPVPVRGAPADPTRRVLGRLSGPSRGPSMRLPSGRCRIASGPLPVRHRRPIPTSICPTAATGTGWALPTAGRWCCPASPGGWATSCARPRPVSRIPAPARRRPDRCLSSEKPR